MYVVSAASLTFVSRPSKHCTKPLRKPCALVAAAETALPLKKNGRMLAEEKSMVNYKHFGYVDFAFSGYENVTSNIQSQEDGDRSRVLVSHSAERKARRRLRPEQTSYPLLPYLVSGFSQLADLVKLLFSYNFKATLA